MLAGSDARFGGGGDWLGGFDILRSRGCGGQAGDVFQIAQNWLLHPVVVEGVIKAVKERINTSFWVFKKLFVSVVDVKPRAF